jgi:hypothetical protein
MNFITATVTNTCIEKDNIDNDDSIDSEDYIDTSKQKHKNANKKSGLSETIV